MPKLLRITGVLVRIHTVAGLSLQVETWMKIEQSLHWNNKMSSRIVHSMN